MSSPVPVPHRTALPTRLFERRGTANSIAEHPLYAEATDLRSEELEGYRGRPDIQASIIAEAIDDLQFVTEVDEARARIADMVVESSLFQYEGVTGKDESQQPTGSFKIHGAANFILKREKEAMGAGVLTASAGNHGQGVAFVAAKLGCKATVVVPEHTPRVKTDGIASHGAKVIRYGETYEDAASMAQNLYRDQGSLYVPAYEHRDVMAGQAMVGQEILRQKQNVTDIVVAAGGLGLLAGIARYASVHSPNVHVWGSGITGASAAAATFHQRRIVEIPGVDTLADNVATRTVGKETFAIAKRLSAGVLTVGRVALAREMMLLDRAGHRAEGAGALPFAVARQHRERLGREVVCVLSGGNVDQATLESCLGTSVDQPWSICYNQR